LAKRVGQDSSGRLTIVVIDLLNMAMSIIHIAMLAPLAWAAKFPAPRA
jgi:hypothetical protein